MIFGDCKKKLLEVHGIICEHMILNGPFIALSSYNNEPTLLLAKSFFKTLPLGVKGTQQ
jgi:hypothetical protein